MTKDEFYIALHNTINDFNWSVDNYGVISTRLDDSALFCPVTAVKFKKDKTFLDITQYNVAGELLGLSEDDTNLIVDAADNRDKKNPLVKQVRETLLKTLNIPPQA